MVLVLLPVLIGAAVVGIASGGQYGDYSAAKMPQYASDEYHEAGREAASSGDDYQDRSPDVPASPDYKYEEELNLRTVNTRNDEDWRKSTKKMPRGQRADVNSSIKQLNTHNSNLKNNPKFKQIIHSRSKSRKTGRKYDFNRNPLRSGRIRSNDIIDKEVDYLSEERYQDRFENNKKSVTSERIVRRKPRDRAVNRPEVEIEDLDDDDEDESKNEQEETKNFDYPASVDSILQERLGEQFEGKEENVHIQRPTPLQIEDDILGRLDSKKEDQKTADEYQDYYDMKRVKNIKKKITVLYRRTKARATGSTTSRRVRVWTYRSSYIDRYATPINEEVLFRATRVRTTKRRKPTARTIKKTATTHKLTRTSKPVKPKSTVITTLTTSTQHTEAIIKTSATINKSEEKVHNISELSLAEKSRLSILKKAQLKDGDVEKSLTAKPPVLLQVSQKMQTMVMLEPQNKAANVELKSKLGNLISEDTPQRLARAKKIMRRRLVAGARNIHDLTDNWDELVCDYLDMAELDGTIRTHLSK
ncbi:PREDICTED: uncharacterized protein LOC106113585 [Papilio xuthus]|uniref:Uncharacterized protein LOC106113585 n=1 Tax=Papilio xuthus TaxID=66420 RepID=A0AAJ6YZ89_PAPXU|nr:PREDICTED: uncharacterized protein LOC106113585 [Papilio xuthus]